MFYSRRAMWLVWVTALVSVACYLRFRRARARLYELADRLPDADPAPLIGNALQFIGGPARILRSILHVCKVVIDKGGVGKVWLGPKLYVVITNPEDAQTVLENCLQKDMVYKFLRPWLGNGLFIAPYELWRVHRRVLLPVFHNKVIEEYIEIFGQQGEVLVRRLAPMSGKEHFDVFKFITACTLDIVFQTAMGERMEVQRGAESPYLRARSTVMRIINMRLFKAWLQPDCLFNLTPYAKQQKNNIDLTHAFADEVIKRKRREYEMEDYQSNGKLRALLDLLLEREIRFSDEQLREHIDSITIAGNDTTALVISYALVLLGAHPAAQDKVYAELKEIMGDSQRSPTKEDILKMQYTERVIKEAMRLYTVVPIIARTAEREIQLSSYTVPAGAGCVIGACAMHRDKRVWGDDADQFDPDRFLPERSRGRHPCAYIPFSHGARNCIGRHFGMLVMKSIIANVVRNFKISSTYPTVDRLKIEIILFPIDGHQLRIEKRQNGTSTRIPIRPVNG